MSISVSLCLIMCCLCLSGFYQCCLGRIISRLEKGILKLLAENERIASFSPSLHERLRRAYESSTAKVKIGRSQLTVASNLFVVAPLFVMALMLNLIPSTVSCHVIFGKCLKAVFFNGQWASELLAPVIVSSELPLVALHCAPGPDLSQ